MYLIFHVKNLTTCLNISFLNSLTTFKQPNVILKLSDESRYACTCIENINASNVLRTTHPAIKYVINMKNEKKNETSL